MSYVIAEVDGLSLAEDIRGFNARVPSWPALADHHLSDGYWWLAWPSKHPHNMRHLSSPPEPVAFAGLVPMSPFDGYGFMKRCYVDPDHHGHGIQYRMMMARLLKAKQLGWTHLVGECVIGNSYSAANFRKAGFDLCEPEQPWAKDALYWIKRI